MGLDLSSLENIGALLKAQDEGKGLRRVRVDAIHPDPNQPRKTFHEESLAELAESIRAIGIIQPPVVRSLGDGYLLIAGERRWRAASLLGLEMIDVIVRDDLEARAQLIENIQREALSHWEVYRVVSAELATGASQADLARSLGKSRAWVTSYAAIDAMPEELTSALREGRVTGVTDLGQLRRLFTAAPDAGRQLLRSPGAIRRESIRKACKGISDLRPARAAASVPNDAAEKESRVDLRPGSAASSGRCAPSSSEDFALEHMTKARLPVRIRVHYENAYWNVDYAHQVKNGDVVSVRLESDNGSACFAAMGLLTLHEIVFD